MVFDSRSKAQKKPKEQLDSDKTVKRSRKKRRHDHILDLPEFGEASGENAAVEASNIASNHSNKIRRTGRGPEPREYGAGEQVTAVAGFREGPELPVDQGASLVRGKGKLRAGRTTKVSQGTDIGTAGPLVDKDQVVEPSSSEALKDTTRIDRGRRAPKFIVFIGNLPFTATTEAVVKHFAKLQPKAVRHRTNKETGISKGFAFLEFDGYDRMKTCLKLYHQSDFHDGLSPTRKINVELTAGGGGSNSVERRSKLKAKNERLNEQRKRKILEETKLKREKGEGAVRDDSDIHPSRRGMIPSS